MSVVRVMHIITGLATGGAEMTLLKLLSRMNRERYSSVVVSLTDKGDLGPRIEALGVPVLTLGMHRGVPSPLGLMRLVRILRAERPSIVQAWMYHGNLAAQLSILLTGRRTPIIWNIRGTHTDLSVEPLVTAIVIWLGARLSGLPTHIVNNSQKSALSHQATLGYRSEKWRIVPNGFDTDLFAPSEDARRRLRAELGASPEALLIGLISRYHPVKGHAPFLQAAALLLRDHPDVRFVLVGEGVDADNAALGALLSSDALKGAVHLLGPRRDIPYLTAGLDIATSSSLSEGFSNTIGEAMSCGIPCVVTDVGDSVWIVGKTGRVVPPSAPEAMAQAWADLIALGPEGRRELGVEARQRVLDEFSLSSVVRQYENLYDEVLVANKDVR